MASRANLYRAIMRIKPFPISGGDSLLVFWMSSLQIGFNNYEENSGNVQRSPACAASLSVVFRPTFSRFSAADSSPAIISRLERSELFSVIGESASKTR